MHQNIENFISYANYYQLAQCDYYDRDTGNDIMIWSLIDQVFACWFFVSVLSFELKLF